MTCLRSMILVFLLVSAVWAEEPAGQDAVASLAARKKEFLAKVAYKPAPFEVTLTPAEKEADGITVQALTFPSPYKSVAPERNDTVRGILFTNDKPRDEVVIVLGGWKRDPATPLFARAIARTGTQMLYLQLPFQENRTPKGQWPGDLTLSADMEQNDASFMQIVLDVRRATDWLVKVRKIDPERIGIMGTSLGGFCAASLYGMDDTFKAAVVLLAGSNVGEVLLQKSWLLQGIASQLEARGFDKEKANARMWAIAPKTWARKDRKDGIYLVAAGADEIVPLAGAKELAKLYGDAPLDIIPGAGHIQAAMNLGGYVDKVRKHFQKQLAKKPVALGSAPRK